MAASTSGGSAGSKRMPPVASTPVETVTMQPRARTRPRGPSTVTDPPGPPVAIRSTGHPSVTERPSACRATSVPKPSRTCGFRPAMEVLA